MLVFSKGSDWAENLFRDLFGSKEIHTEVSENIRISPDDIVFLVENDDQVFSKGIVIKTKSYKKESPVEPEARQNRDIPLPVVLRIFKKTVPLSEIDSIGETSEIFLSNGKQLDVDLLVNGEVIGKGLLKKENEEFRLRITELYI